MTITLDGQHTTASAYVCQGDNPEIFSVAAVVLMPPTLIASIYGMNFKHMPELETSYGYPATLIVMLIAAILPYWFFKWKKWL